MAFIEMVCSCEGSFHMDSDINEDVMLLFAHRFANAHAGCGYMSVPGEQTVKESAVARHRILTDEDD